MLPRLFNDNQKERYMQMYQDIIDRQKTCPDLLLKVITIDETWIFEYY